MPQAKCKICNNIFYPRPYHVKRGWGVYCSLKCKYKGTEIKIKQKCFTCGKEIFRVPSKLKHTKSGKFFCDKSCQTKWRNVQYSGEKHLGWKGGFSIYKNILVRSGATPICQLCKTKDERVLAVHHIDENHKNNKLSNLAWLCHNCHYLIHHDRVEKLKFIN